MIVALAHGVGLLALVLLAYRLLLRRFGGRRPFRLLSGVLFGAATVLSMMDAATVADGVIVDLRNVMVALAGLFGGWPAAAVSAALGGAYRLWLGGAGMPTGLLGLGLTAIVASLAAPVLRRKGAEPGLWRLALLGLLVSPLTLAAFLLLPSPDLVRTTLGAIALPLTGFTVLGIALLGTMLSREHRRVADERALAESEAMFRAVFDHSADSLFIARVVADGSFALQRGNAAAFVAFGIEAEGAQGKPLDAVLPPEAAAKLTADLQACIDSGGPIRFEDKETRNGVTRFWEVSQVPIRDARGAIAMVSVGARDITRRHEAERTIRESEARYRLLARSVSDVISRIGLDGVRRFCSEAVRDSLGCEPSEMVGRPLVERIHPDDRAAVADGLGRMTPTSPTMKSTYRMRHADGHWVWIESALRLVADDWGAPLEFVSVERDVTARKAMEAELHDARQAAEAANRSKGEFLASLSHELRTPMNAVIGFADLIARESEGPIANPFYKDFAANIRDSGQHLLELINEILDNVRAEAGQLVLEEETVDLEQAATFAVRLLTPRAGRAGIALSASVDPKARYLRGDDKRIRQILLNLLTNAVKYTPAGGRVSVETALEPGGGLRLEVRDNGMGIAEQDLGRVLQAFGRVENDATRPIEGTGLGLPLTRRLVELHGGTLALSSTVGQGTTAAVRFPAGRVADERGRTSNAPLERAQAPLSILMVEDDQTIRETGLALLRGWGHRAVGAVNANEALVVLRSPEPLDLLFTDIVMPPGMNGAELAREARRLRPGLPVLLASGFAAHAVVADDVAQAGYDQIAKPYDPAELQQRLDGLRPLGEAVAMPVPERPAAPPPPGPLPGPPAATESPAESSAEAPAEALRILVAEDVEMNRLLIVTILKQLGHRVVAVEDGAAAVAAVRRHPFDLILMDVNMPVMDGLVATRTIRDMAPPANRIPIVAMTANTFPEDVARCRAAGMSGYVPKPIDRRLLVAEIARCAVPAPDRPATTTTGSGAGSGAGMEAGLAGKGRPTV
ncbi:PAS domain S-box-containing protein [Azospirillum agricola]|uniref:response regulator n=1 Tax=Azospirillum agricola TaxID=1720247 RepID=UPI001F17EC43|nr:response regulator [Azospirillum agricola]MBP2232784.1 PAS domain S-box-containing protein [Azospirillum agricola]